MRVSFLCLLAATVFLAGCAPDKEVSRKRAAGRKPQPREVHSAPGFSSLTYAEAPAPITESGDEGDEGNEEEATAKTVLRDAIAEAKASGKQLFVQFGAQW